LSKYKIGDIVQYIQQPGCVFKILEFKRHPIHGHIVHICEWVGGTVYEEPHWLKQRYTDFEYEKGKIYGAFSASNLRFKKPEEALCPACSGTGLEKDYVSTCKLCQGQGVIYA